MKKQTYNFTLKLENGTIIDSGKVESSTLRGACSLANCFNMRKLGEGEYCTTSENPLKYRFGSPERKAATEARKNFVRRYLTVVLA